MNQSDIERAWQSERLLHGLSSTPIDPLSLARLAFKTAFQLGFDAGVDSAFTRIVPAFAAPRPGIDCPFNPETDRCQAGASK